MKKKISMKWICLVIILFFTMSIAYAEENEDLTIYHEIDDNNCNANFFVNNNTDRQICIVCYVYEQKNAYGGVVSGVIILAPNEKKFLFGSFIRKDPNKEWSVGVGVKEIPEPTITTPQLFEIFPK